MAVEERSRRQLQEALMDAIGPEQTDTLFGYLPPTGWADVATTRDLEAMRAELRGEISELRGEVSGLRSELRSEVSGLRSELHSDVGALRADMNTLAATLRGELHRELRVHFYSLAMLMAALLAIALAVPSTGLIG